MLFESIDVVLEFLRAHPSWFFIPITRLEKGPPLIKDDLRLASNDEKQLRAWHAKWRGCNWALSCAKSGLIVADVDCGKGKKGLQTFNDILLARGFDAFPPTLKVRTPSGGFHLYYQCAPDEHRYAQGKYGFGPNIDSTNYVIIPGCMLSNGKTYEIIDNTPVAARPDWFAEALERRESELVDQIPIVNLDQPGNVQWCVTWLQNEAPPSVMYENGEKTLFDVAGVLKDHGMSEDMAIDLLDQYYNVPGKCEPIWNVRNGAVADDLAVKVHNAYIYKRETQPGALTPEAAFAFDDDVIDCTPLARRFAQIEKDKVETKPFQAAPSKLDAPQNLDEELRAEAKRLPATDLGAELEIEASRLDAIPDEDTFDQVCQNWVWVIGMERMVRRRDGMLWTKAQFDSKYNAYCKDKSITTALFKTKERLRRFERLVFRPGYPEEIGRDYNVWRASEIVPKEGDARIWNEHLNYMFQNPADRDKLLDWLAWIYQNQQLKPNHALLIVGRNTGTGKSFIARVFEELIGPINTQRPKNSSLKGDFNSWVMNCKLCIIEELQQVGKKEVSWSLRDMITEPTIEVNMKNVPAFKIENHMCMMAISNHPDALAMDDTDRRWLVLNTNVVSLDTEYYDRLFAALEDKGTLAAIAWELKNRKLGKYSGLAKAPPTDAKTDMIELSRSDAETWLLQNKSNTPLNRKIVSIQDILDHMPAALQKTPRLITTTIPMFLKDWCRGEKLGYVWLADGRRLNLWGLHGHAFTMKEEGTQYIANLYQSYMRGDRKQADERAAEDFD